MKIREFVPEDLEEMRSIWNQVVEAADAFPQEKDLEAEEAYDFFKNQSFTGVAEEDGKIAGLYILHPNNVGRCGHISNASYAVRQDMRGRQIGEKLVRHSIQKAEELGFGILQFNAVVASNHAAVHLYEKIGFAKLGTIPKGFRTRDGYQDIILYYIPLTEE
ncbi:GNAT family N-acetyltransferase [Anaerostipes sp.]|uniref:GNAT family N-acetyltransferase n=1 Tax=Anaerostipes sp. TaxID=1872530 RepID=UPI00257BE091|nr:GNAT family N-acetyltransferase [Anaerostipes sp.]